MMKSSQLSSKSWRKLLDLSKHEQLTDSWMEQQNLISLVKAQSRGPLLAAEFKSQTENSKFENFVPIVLKSRKLEIESVKSYMLVAKLKI